MNKWLDSCNVLTRRFIFLASEEATKALYVVGIIIIERQLNHHLSVHHLLYGVKWTSQARIGSEDKQVCLYSSYSCL